MVKKPIIAMSAPVTITAAIIEGESKGPAKFDATFYTGGALDINGWELPVVVDLAGLERGKVLVANLDHEPKQRVGNFDVMNDGKTLVAHGTATAKTAARDEVIGSAVEGYQWQASLEVNPHKVDEIAKGKKVEVNGQEFTGPLYVTRKGVLKGFAFVSHGADDNTAVSIAAIAAKQKEQVMDAKAKAWAAEMGIDVDNASPEQIANIEANYAGQEGKKVVPVKASSANPFETAKLEATRQKELREIADQFVEKRKYDLKHIEAIEKRFNYAVESEMAPQLFRNEMLEASIELAGTVRAPVGEPQLNNNVIEASLAMTTNLPDLEKSFDARTLQFARDKFKTGIGLKELFLMCAKSRGYYQASSDFNGDVLHACFDRNHSRIHGTGFSALDISTILSNTANKSAMAGWNAVDQTCLRISKRQSVRDFKQITVVSVTDSLRYEQVGNDGQIKHGTLGELTYNNQIFTYAKMLAITRTDIINDDTNALTDVPGKLGRGAIKMLNHIFWTEFLSLVSASFFASGNANINTGVADMSVGGLDGTETVFMNQTNPDGTPLALEPRIILVPSALKNKAITLMSSEQAVYSTSFTSASGNANPFRGRFTVESSPYISNSTYTGNTSTAWWMLADPNELPVIAIAGLNGRVEPTVDTAEADFSQLGVQMRGYADFGVKRQEYRGGVHADGTT